MSALAVAFGVTADMTRWARKRRIPSIGFFMTSLINLALEARIALHEYDHFGGK
jgi:hypothetical protein